MEGEDSDKLTNTNRDGKTFAYNKKWMLDWRMTWRIRDGKETEAKAVTLCSSAGFVGAVFVIPRVFLGPVRGAGTAYGVIPKLGLMGSIIGSNIVAAATYVYVVSSVAEIRGKSDEYNHALGGASAGAILALKYKSLKRVSQRSIAGGLIGVLMYTVANWKCFPNLRNSLKAPPLRPSGSRWRTPTNVEHEKIEY